VKKSTEVSPLLNSHVKVEQMKAYILKLTIAPAGAQISIRSVIAL
jgi:hypothetical protein